MNTVLKYLTKNKQIRVYILYGKQIYNEVIKLNISDYQRNLFKRALNITALFNALDTGKERVSYVFQDKIGTSKITTNSFSNNTITAVFKFDKLEHNLKGGTLQTISTINIQYGGAHISYSELEYGDIYKDIEQYYLKSEQITTYIVPICEDTNSDNIVILVQPLPFANNKYLENTLDEIKNLNIKSTKYTIEMIEELFSKSFVDYNFLDKIIINYHCGCSKELFLGVIFTLSNKEKNSIIARKESIHVSCPLCGKEYIFSYTDILNYMK